MLDSLDHKILDLLQENGRLKRKDLADEIGLSLPSLSERLNKLEDHGIIEGYFTKLNRHTFGYDILAFIVVVMESSKNYKKLLENSKQIPEILECHSVLGEGSHLLKVLVKSTKELESLLSTIQSWPGVVRTITNFVLSTSKETTKIKL